MEYLSQSELGELRKLEEDLWKTETRFNEPYMRELMSTDFVEYGRSGRIYNLEEILSIEPRSIEVTFPLPDLEVRQLSDDVVQVTYNSIINAVEGIEYAHRSSIWSRSNGNWKLRFHQGTPYTPGT